jgi:hypothetical protein
MACAPGTDLRDTEPTIDAHRPKPHVDADAKDCRFNLVMGTAPGVERTLEICGVLPALNRVRTVDSALDESDWGRVPPVFG